MWMICNNLLTDIPFMMFLAWETRHARVHVADARSIFGSILFVRQTSHRGGSNSNENKSRLFCHRFFTFTIKNWNLNFCSFKKSVKRSMLSAFAGLSSFIRSEYTPLWNWLVRNPYLQSCEQGHPPTSKCWCKLSYRLIVLINNAAQKLKTRLSLRPIRET